MHLGKMWGSRKPLVNTCICNISPCSTWMSCSHLLVLQDLSCLILALTQLQFVGKLKDA